MRPTDERSPFLCFVCTPASICDSRGRNVSDQTEMWLEPRQGLSRVLIGCHSQLLPRNSSHPPQQSHPSVRSLFLVHRESFPNRLAVHPYPCHNFGCHDTSASVFFSTRSRGRHPGAVWTGSHHDHSRDTVRFRTTHTIACGRWSLLLSRE